MRTNQQETKGLVTFTEESLDDKFHFFLTAIVKETSTNFIQSSNKDTTTTLNLIQIPSLLLLNTYLCSEKTCSNISK